MSITVACLCSNAEFSDTKENTDKPANQREVRGDPTEAGILKVYESIMGDSAEVRKSCPQEVNIPFNSTNKYQV